MNNSTDAICDAEKMPPVVSHRRRWTLEEKIRVVAETRLPGGGVALVAGRYGVTDSQVLSWRRRINQTGGGMMSLSEYRALEAQMLELKSRLEDKVVENTLLRETLSNAIAAAYPQECAPWCDRTG